MKTIGDIIHKNKFPIRIYDLNDNLIYMEYVNGLWWRQQYNLHGDEIYYENSRGYVEDNRPEYEINCKHNPSE